MKSLAGKKIFLTGAAGGLGREFTRQLLLEGSLLVLTDIDEARLKKIAEGIAASLLNVPGRVIGVFGADLSSAEGCEDAYQKCKKTAPELDVLINNAGVLAFGDFQDVPEGKWEQVIKVNLLGPMRLSYKFLPDMLKRKQGHIVNISSIAGITGTTQSASYSASKFGLRGFGMSLSGEVSEKGVDVTNIYPLWTDTEILKTRVYGKTKMESVKSIFLCRPEDVVRAAIKGIRKKKLHVYPGFFAKMINLGAKFTPIVGSQRRSILSWAAPGEGVKGRC